MPPSTMDAPPSPSNPVERARVEHTRQRRRIIYSMHEPDVRQRIVDAVGPTRAKVWHLVDMTSNPAWYVCSQLAALCREVPEVDPPDGAEDVAAAILEAGWWQLAQRNQRDTIAFNDNFVRVSVADDGTPSFRLVPPDMIKIVASPLAPSQPLAVKEWIADPDDSSKWVRLICDPRRRIYEARDADGIDVTKRVLGDELGGSSFSGEAYPFLVNGKPVLPYVGYHAAESGYALDPYTGREVFEGALQLGVYYSFFGHILRNAAWAQRWMMNVEPADGDIEPDGRRREHITDPAMALMLRQIEDTVGQPQVGQFAPPVDPDRFLTAIERYEQRLVSMALSTVGVSRRDSDVRSAMSLAVSREAQREAQRAYEPVFQRSDLRLARLVAGLSGAPTAGWKIRYRSLPRDPAELAAEMDLISKQLAEGLIDLPAAYRKLHPGMEPGEAEAAIAQIAETNARLRAAA